MTNKPAPDATPAEKMRAKGFAKPDPSALDSLATTVSVTAPDAVAEIRSAHEQGFKITLRRLDYSQAARQDAEDISQTLSELNTHRAILLSEIDRLRAELDAAYTERDQNTNELQAEIDRLTAELKGISLKYCDSQTDLNDLKDELDARDALLTVKTILLQRIYEYCDNYDGEPSPLETIMQMIEEAEDDAA